MVIILSNNSPTPNPKILLFGAEESTFILQWLVKQPLRFVLLGSFFFSFFLFLEGGVEGRGAVETAVTLLVALW